MTFATLFSNAVQAAKYSQYRPTYPEELYTNILDISNGGTRQLVVDIATGTGQAAIRLAELYDKVVAQDGSAEQLQHAVQRPNIQYQQADAHHTGLPDRCADLVTVAQALHWFKHAEFYREVRRILKPTGVFAAWTYCVPILVHKDHPAQQVVMQLYHDTLGPYWAGPRRHVEVGYRGIEPSTEDFLTVVRREMEITYVQTVDELMGYFETWSAYQTYLREHPDRPDPLLDFRKQLMQALGAADGSAPVNVITPLTLIMAKEPQPLCS